MGELPPIPPGMNASFDHDGAHWRLTRNLNVALVAFAMALLTGTLLVPYWPWSLGPAAVIWPISGLVLVQSLQRTQVRVNSHELTLEQRSLGRIQRRIVRVDDIVHHAVATSDRGESALVVKTREETVVIGAGCDPRHLAWLAQAVGAARRLTGLREQEEGREWSFLRRAPEALDVLRR
jgi:hypothetical protein